MATKTRMTDERFGALEQSIKEAVLRIDAPFVDFDVFLEVFNELKAMRKERK